MTEPVGFIGLGNLGAPVASNLLKAGFALSIYNRTASKGDRLVAEGAKRAASPTDAVIPNGVVVTLLWDDASVEETVESEGFLERLGPGGVHISLSTVSPEASKRLAARHAGLGSSFIEAPIFGRPEAASARKLWIPYAGPRLAKERVKPLFQAMGAQESFDFGEDIGAATTVKLVGNFLISSAARSMVEGLAMVERSGFDAKATIQMLTETLFTAPIYQSYGKMIAEKTLPTGQSDIGRKDLGLFKAAADKAGASTPMSSLLLDLLSARPQPPT